MNRNRSSDASALVNVDDLVDEIQNREDFVTFVRALERELRTKPQEWENRDLPAFLAALGAWAEDMEGYFRNSGKAMPSQPTWSLLAKMLSAARVYE